MTMIDEDVLSRVLHDAATAFEASDDAVTRILAEAAVETPKPLRRVPTFLVERSRRRSMLIATACLVAVGAIALPLFRDEAASPRRTPLLTTASTFGPSTGGLALSPSSAAPNGTSLSVSAGQNEKTSHGASTSNQANATSQKIESTGKVDLTVHRGGVALAIAKLTDVAMKDGGLVASTVAHVGTHTSGQFASATVILEVPQRNFTSLVAQVQRVGHATSVATSSNNVTGQYVDLQARISELKVSLAQYERIMARASTISGILAVQSQIDALQSQIEQYQGALKVLSNETTYGALTVNLTQPGHRIVKTHPRTGFDKAWHDSISGFVAGFEWLVRLAGPALFAVALLAALYLLGRFSRRAVLRRRI